LPWITALSGVFVGIGQSPCETRIWRRTSSLRAFQTSTDAGGVKGK
jgi:hypothetical protein